MMLAGLLAILTLLFKLAPDAPLARHVHRMCVVWPLEQLSHLTLQKTIFGVLLLGFMIGGGEMMLLLGPELVAGYAMQLSIYLDAVLVTCVLAAWSRIKVGVTHARLLAARLLPRRSASRRKRMPRTKPERPGANDDEPERAVLPLAA